MKCSVISRGMLHRFMVLWAYRLTSSRDGGSASRSEIFLLLLGVSCDAMTRNLKYSRRGHIITRVVTHGQTGTPLGKVQTRIATNQRIS